MKAQDKVPQFESRWRIRGTLTTLGPLHVGDGGELEMTKRQAAADKSNNQSDASTVCTDWQGRPCIPGSAIKGALRARVKAAGVWNTDPSWAKLLGPDSKNVENFDAEGGKVEFSDALMPNNPTPPTFGPRHGDTKKWLATLEQTGAPPFWNSKRFTGVAVSVSLDRRTRTAKEHLLYHIEYVPASVSFDFELTGDNLTDGEVAKLLALLETFNHDDTTNPQPVTLGAQASNSWGRVQWKLTEAACFKAADLTQWLANPAAFNNSSGYAMCKPLASTKLAEIQKKKPSLTVVRNLLTIELTLHFPGPLLVRDPQQPSRVKKAKDDGVDQNQKPPDATPVLDANGFPCIPEKSARGVLRTRAEMILRTLGHKIPEPSDPKIKPAQKIEDVKKFDPVRKIFGASGWRAPVQISAFTWADRDDPRWLRQEFVAIDRFTGGAAPEKKFNANAVVGAKLKGTITLDLDRLGKCGAQEYAEGLLALILRDLNEGDLIFGSGGAKGYGECKIETVTITRTTPANTYSTLDAWFTDASTSLKALRDFPLHSTQPQQETANA